MKSKFKRSMRKFYIDWFHKDAEKYWVNEMSTFHSKLEFDGFWIDMNEASNFFDGYCYQDQKVDSSMQNKLLYVPGARDLNVKSISIDAKHSIGTTEFEAHSLYGFYMSKATFKYFNDAAKVRPFIITRSSYTGVGNYASYWLETTSLHTKWWNILLEVFSYSECLVFLLLELIFVDSY